MDGCYKLKNEIESLIQEGRLKKYIKGNFSIGSYESNSERWDQTYNPGCKKGKEPTKGWEKWSVLHTRNTFARGFDECKIYNFSRKEQALQVLVIDGLPINSMECES